MPPLTLPPSLYPANPLERPSVCSSRPRLYPQLPVVLSASVSSPPSLSPCLCLSRNRLYIPSQHIPIPLPPLLTVLSLSMRVRVPPPTATSLLAVGWERAPLRRWPRSSSFSSSRPLVPLFSGVLRTARGFLSRASRASTYSWYPSPSFAMAKSCVLRALFVATTARSSCCACLKAVAIGPSTGSIKVG